MSKDEVDQDKIFKSNITKVALETDLYTLPGTTATQKMALEKFYSENIENHYDNIYEILTDPSKSNVTSEERELIISTVVTMFYRTTSWIYTHNEFMQRNFESLYLLCEQQGTDYFMFGDKKMSIAGKSLDEFTKEYNKESQPELVSIQIEAALKLINLRIQKDAIMITKLSGSENEYITSDNPVIASNRNQDYLMPFDPENILRLPLDNKHLLSLLPHGEKDTINKLFRHSNDAKYEEVEKIIFNHMQQGKSQRFLLGSKTGLINFIDSQKIVESWNL